MTLGALASAFLLAPASAHAASVWVFWVAKPTPGPPLFVGLDPLSKNLYAPMRLVPPKPPPGNLGQEWTFVAVQYLGATGYRIVNRHSGQCLAVPDTSSNHAPARQETCRFGNSVWRFYIPTASRRFGPVAPTPSATTAYQLQNGITGKCLDVTNFAAVAGTRLQQFTCTEGWNQRFRLNRSDSP